MSIPHSGYRKVVCSSVSCRTHVGEHHSTGITGLQCIGSLRSCGALEYPGGVLDLSLLGLIYLTWFHASG